MWLAPPNRQWLKSLLGSHSYMPSGLSIGYKAWLGQSMHDKLRKISVALAFCDLTELMSTSRRLTKKRTGRSSRIGNTVAKSAISQPTLLVTDSALKITEYNVIPIPRNSSPNAISRRQNFINHGLPKRSRSTPMVLSSNQHRHSKDDFDIIYSTRGPGPQQRDSDSRPSTAEGLVDTDSHTLNKR